MPASPLDQDPAETSDSYSTSEDPNGGGRNTSEVLDRSLRNMRVKVLSSAADYKDSGSNFTCSILKAVTNVMCMLTDPVCRLLEPRYPVQYFGSGLLPSKSLEQVKSWRLPLELVGLAMPVQRQGTPKTPQALSDCDIPTKRRSLRVFRPLPTKFFPSPA
jgi:hypothetical protein